MGSAARDLFVISDLHLGDGGVRDNFEAGHKTRQLHSFLDHVGSEGGELFILGDLFELWQMNTSLLLVKRRELLDRFVELPLTYIPGNHDIDLIHFIGTDLLSHPFFRHMRQPFYRDLGGKRFRFFHGHEVDPFNAGDAPGFGRMLSIFGGIFEDQNGSPLLESGKSAEDVLEQFGESMLALWSSAMISIAGTAREKPVAPAASLTPAQNPNRLVEHVNEVRADRVLRGYDVAVMGHTHHPGRIGDWYANSGSWARHRDTFLRITPDGHVRHFEWREGHPVEREAPEILAEIAPKNPIEAAMVSVRTLFPKQAKLQRPRWSLVLQGLLALIVGVGVLTVSITDGTSAGWRMLVVAFGSYALSDGILSLLGSFRDQPIKRFLYRVRGVTSLLLGTVILVRGYAVEVFAILVGVWAFIAGALSVVAARLLRGVIESRWLKLLGAGSLIAGLCLLLFPAKAVWLKFALSGYLCFYGAGEVLAGLFARRPR